MLNYENSRMLNNHEWEHIVEITLQIGNLKGTFKQRMGIDSFGQRFGQDVLYHFNVDVLTKEDISEFIENNCNLKIYENDYGEDWYSCTLRDDKGRECIIEDNAQNLKELVVKIEIIDCKKIM